MLYSHVTLLMLRVVDVVAKTTVQQSARMLVAEIHGEIQVLTQPKLRSEASCSDRRSVPDSSTDRGIRELRRDLGAVRDTEIRDRDAHSQTAQRGIAIQTGFINTVSFE